MRVKNGKITRATEKELFEYYLKRELEDVYSFPDYLEKMKYCGVIVTDEVESE